MMRNAPAKFQNAGTSKQEKTASGRVGARFPSGFPTKRSPHTEESGAAHGMANGSATFFVLKKQAV
jgi:hypothetical protein